MASTYSTNLKIELIATGEQSGTWGTTTNTNLGTALEQAIVGYGNPNFTTDADLTISLTDSNATQTARNLALNVTSSVSLTATRNLIVPTIQKPYLIYNNTTGSQSIVVKTSAGTGVTVPNGAYTVVYVDGTNVVSQITQLPALTLATALAATSGGTGQSSYAVGDLLYASTTTALSKLADVATGNALISGGVATAPSWGKIDLTTHVSGTLPVANGGTGSASLTANNVILGNGTSAVQVVAPGTSGNVLTSNGTTWQSTAPNPGALKYDLYTSGTSTWTAPTGVTRVKVICIGGGGGGGVYDGSTPQNGGSGGRGGIAVGIYTVTPGTGYTATVGAGGAGSNSTSGSAGGSSSLGALLSATGGGGGQDGAFGGNDGADGAGASGITANSSVSYGAGGAFVGANTRGNATSATAAVTWTASLNRVPGANGQGGTNTSNATGGTGGVVYIEYVG